MSHSGQGETGGTYAAQSTNSDNQNAGAGEFILIPIFYPELTAVTFDFGF